MPKFRPAFLMLALSIIAPHPSLAQGDPDTIRAIVQEGKINSQVMDLLHHLTKRIGHRLTSSPQLERAYKWTQSKFKEFGCKNVHLEKWGEYPVGFDRGKRQFGRMISPEKHDFVFTSASWTPGTKGATKGKAIVGPTSMEEFSKVKDQVKGTWLVYKSTSRLDAELAAAIKAAGPNGYVYGSRSDLVLTSGRHIIKWDELPTDVKITIRKQDMDTIQKQFEANKEVVLEFNMDNKLIKGPISNYNVIAEIPGTEHPEEVVIVSGHLDSWDGPGSEGAQDNGNGTCVTLEAARILTAVGAKPKRTIRFILWSGEEQGLFGSVQYVKDHKADLDKISAVFVEDGGTNYEGGLTCTAEMEPILSAAIDPASRAFPDMPMTIKTAARVPRFGGSDHFPFQQVGVPAFFWNEVGKGDYNHVHHTQYDTYETEIPEYAVQSAVNSASVIYIVACAPTMLPREKPRTNQ